MTFLELDVIGKYVHRAMSHSFSLAAGSYQTIWNGFSAGTGAIHATARVYGGQTGSMPGPEVGAGTEPFAITGFVYAALWRRKARGGLSCLGIHVDLAPWGAQLRSGLGLFRRRSPSGPHTSPPCCLRGAGSCGPKLR